MNGLENLPQQGRVGFRECLDRRLGVVIVTYNSADVLPGLLNSLSAGLQGIENFEIVVVDNSSHDESVALASAHAIGVTVIQSGRNAGYSAAINIATDYLGKDADVLVLNPDIRLQRGCVARMYNAFRDGRVGIVVPQILHDDGTLSKSIRREPSLMTVWSEALVGGRIASRLELGEMVNQPGLYRAGGAVEWATGAILLISARARAAIGDWDESFFLYSEEVDYFKRLRDAAFVAEYVPEARAVHIGGDYERSGFLSALMAVNRIRYYARGRGRIPSSLFRLGIIVGEFLRWPKSAAHRAAFNAALTVKLNS